MNAQTPHWWNARRVQDYYGISDVTLAVDTAPLVVVCNYAGKKVGTLIEKDESDITSDAKPNK